MEAIRRNTDYGLRMMVILARHHGDGEWLSATQLARSASISLDVGRMQLKKLGKAKLVKSVMGSKGGFKLNRNPVKISVRQIIEILQGKIYMNKCLTDKHGCEFETGCEVNVALRRIQRNLNHDLGDLTLEKVLRNKGRKEQ